MIAKVLIDIAHSAVDQLYDYKVPPHLEPILCVGQRVEVFFHGAKRSGTVLKTQKTSSLKNLKTLIDVLDVKPPLNDRLRALAEHLHQRYTNPLQSYHHAMTPRALNVKRVPTVRKVLDHPSIDAYFGSRQTCSIDAFKDDAKTLKAALKEGLIVVETKLEETTKRPQETRLKMIQDAPVRGPKQAEILRLLRQYPEGLSKRTTLALTHATSSTVKRLVDQGILEEMKQPLAFDVMPHQTLKPTPLNARQTQQKKQLINGLLKRQSGWLEGFIHHDLEVVIQTIEALLSQNKTVLILVPDLLQVTPFYDQLRARLKVPVGLLSSLQAPSSQRHHWHAIKEGKTPCVIGTRMAIFAPLDTLDVVVMCDAHAPHYHQEETPRYDTFEITQWFYKEHHIPTLYVTPTPPLSVWQAVKHKTMFQASLETPKKQLSYHVIDQKAHLLNNPSMITPPLLEAIQKTLALGEQVVLLKNRKGYATSQVCEACGYVIRCEACELPMTVHQENEQLLCHHCHRHTPLTKQCPRCEAPMRHLGSGTEQLEILLKAHFPDAKHFRLDHTHVGSVSARKEAQKTMPQADIIVGTQMLATSVAFSKATLLGIIDADELFNAPTFDPSLDALQLWRQLALQSGVKLDVMIQTYQPTHPVIEAFIHDRDEAYYDETLALRKTMQWPPFVDLTVLTLADANEDTAYQKTLHLKHYLTKACRDHVTILGPTPHPFYKRDGAYRYQLSLKATSLETYQASIARAVKVFAPRVSVTHHR